MIINWFILYQVSIVSRDRGKPIRDPTGLICFFYKKMDSVLKMSLSIEYHTKSDPPLRQSMDTFGQRLTILVQYLWFLHKRTFLWGWFFCQFWKACKEFNYKEVIHELCPINFVSKIRIEKNHIWNSRISNLHKGCIGFWI